ncbi:MAG: hypothetical protein ACXVCS_02035 [Bdellovibrionota bacterium]
MRLRRRALIIPLLALVGILLALYFLWKGKTSTENIPPLELAVPAATSTATSATPAPAPAAARVAQKAPSDGHTLTKEEIGMIQSEARISLASLYSAEKSYFSEYNRYSTDFNQIGYSPEGDKTKQLHVRAGFLRAYEPEHPNKFERPDFMSNEEFVKMEKPWVSYAPEAEKASLEDASRYCHEGCTASDHGFEIAVVSQINGQTDVWTINDRKMMIHETPGIQ